MNLKRGRWSLFRDGAGWSFGYYPTNDSPRTFTVQNIRDYCTNVDVCWRPSQDWRLKWTRHPIPHGWVPTIRPHLKASRPKQHDVRQGRID